MTDWPIPALLALTVALAAAAVYAFARAVSTILEATRL